MHHGRATDFLAVWPEKKQREHYCPIRDVGLYKHHGRAAALLAININELSPTIDYMFFLCAFDLKEGRSDGRSPVPKFTTAIFTFALFLLFTRNGIWWNASFLPHL
ncbi:hypothetical protein TNCV_1824681 [Trichonephila clavipes]|nr:hypothetical protein TNCV_1824681 [Trichonephila clavipes]